MEFRHLRAALAVADHHHFGRAAAEMGITQPAISQAIKALESDLGVALFERTTRSVEPTEAGKEFLDRTRTALSILTAARGRAQQVGRGDAGSLVIATVGSAQLHPIPLLISAFRRQHPDVQLSIDSLTTAEQIRRFAAATLDVGFVRTPLPAVAATELALDIVARERLMAVLPRGHRLMRRARVPVGLLAGEPFIRTPRHLGPGLYDAISSLCRMAGFEPNVTQEVAQMDSVTMLVGAGYGVSIVPESVAKYRADRVAFVPVTPTATVELALARSNTNKSPTVTQFIALANDLIGPFS